MITVNEILNLSLFQKFKILCGKEFLNNDVMGAVILEYESSRIDYAGYCYGEFVLLSYFMAQSNPELVNYSLRNIIQKHVSAIAIKKLPEEKIPDDIIELAKANRVPILTFYDEFMEDLIVSINESLRTKAQYIIFEEKLNALVSGHPSPETVQKTAMEINPNFLPNIITASITSKENPSNVSIHSYLDSMAHRQYRNKKDYSFSFVKSGFGFILICSFSNDDIPTNKAQMQNAVKDILIGSGISPKDYYIGISDIVMPLSKLNISVLHAKNSNAVCQYLDTDCMEYSALGLYKYVMNIVNDPLLYEEIEQNIQILINYDEIHTSNLLATLIVFVNHYGDYTKTAKELFQHTNTIRYRIKKVTELLLLPDQSASNEIIILVLSYLLHNAINK